MNESGGSLVANVLGRAAWGALAAGAAYFGLNELGLDSMLVYVGAGVAGGLGAWFGPDIVNMIASL